MNKVLLKLAVHHDQMLGSGNGTKLYRREMETAFPPPPDAPVFVFPDEDVEMNVKSCYWRFDGTIVCALVDVQINPNQQMQRHIDGKYRTSWYTKVDGDLDAMLIEAGWETD